MKYMKVGILTYHFSINCGAVLQCYALQEYYANQKIDVEIINYISPKQQDNIALYRREINSKNFLKNILLFPFHSKRKVRLQRFQYFQEEYLKCSKTVKNKNELKQLIIDDDITHIVVGSDQVWNPLIGDFDSVFFLDFDSKIHKLGYSISLGYAKKENIEPYKKWIDQFENFSMREKSGKDIICSLGNYNPTITVDPTLLLDKIFWEKLISKISTTLQKRNYILCYFLNRKHYKDNYRFAKKIAKDKNLELYTIDYAIHKDVLGHKSIKNFGPLEFLSAIHDARYVVTDSFHGTVFSLVYNKRFISIKNDSNAIDTRRIELLSAYNLVELYRTINQNYDAIDNIQYNDDEIDNNLIFSSRKYALDIIED